MTTTLNMPGKVYYACFDPMATGVPGEAGWPEPTTARAGRGIRLTYTVTPEQRTDMIDHAWEWASGLTFGVDPETAAEARAVLRWAEANR